MAVVPTHQGRGIASRLVETCLAEARGLGLSEIFLLTLAPEFFQRFGFRVVSREDLLPIVWADCVNCVKFPDCDEIPMLLDLTAPDPGINLTVMGRCVIFLTETSSSRRGDAVGRKMNPAASVSATFDHAFISPVKPGFIGVFYWQTPI